MLLFSLVIFLNICVLLSAAETQYPVRIDELGDFIVAKPIFETRPEGTELVEPLQSFPRRESMTQTITYQLKCMSLETIASVFIEKLRRPRKLDEKLQFNETELFLVSVLESRMNHFNPSILEGIHDPDMIIAFGAPFFRIFKLAYPGLQRVRLSRREIVYLAWLAACWGMDHSEDNDHDSSGFLIKCCRTYYPRCIDIPSIFSYSLYIVYKSGSMIAFEAACQLFANRIPCRNFVFDGFSPANSVAYFLGDNEPVFFKLLPFVENINDTELGIIQDRHLLFRMIRYDLFYPDLMLRPELKDFRIPFEHQNHFEDFYSEALYLALYYKNIEAIRFLLNLDPDYYNVPMSAAETDGSDANLDPHPRPIAPETLAALKAIFLSETLDEILIAVLDVENFTFFNWDINRFIMEFQDCFHGLQLLANRFKNQENLVANRKRLFDHSDSSEDFSGHKRHFHRSDSTDSP